MPDFTRWLLNASKAGRPLPPGEFVWSPAKHFLFRKCRRAWFFRHYLAQGGWNSLSADPAAHAFLLKYLDTADSWMSSTAEDSLSGALLDTARIRDESRKDELTEAFQVRVSARLLQAREDLSREAALDDPKRTSFLELHYDTGEYHSAQELLTVIRNRFRDFFRQWESSGLSEELAAVDTLDWRLPPEYRLFHYAGRQISLRPWIYAVQRRTVRAWTIHFAYSTPDQVAGFPQDDEEYGLPEKVFAAWCAARYPDFEVEVNKIYLTGEDMVRRKEIPAPVSEDLVVCSSCDMLEAVNHPDGLRSEKFPRLTDRNQCVNCRFRSLCDTEGVPPEEDEGSDPEGGAGTGQLGENLP